VPRPLLSLSVASVLVMGLLVGTTSPPPSSPSASASARTAVATDDYELARASTTTFRVASFNALGDSHTRAGGRVAYYASGATRTGWMITLLNRHRVDVVGLQEFQPAQHQALRKRAGRTFSIFPGAQRAQRNKQNAIAWRSSTFSLVKGFTVPITYMGGQKVPMPVVRLRAKATGQELYVITVHNAPGRFPAAARHRAAALHQEVALTKRLLRTGLPVFLTGDMNDREAFFCPYTRQVRMHAAAGGTNRGACKPPPGRIARVDWIFGSRDVTFGQYRFIKDELVRRTTDHPLVLARATIRD
jgi:endonuclease/exonuclease/phosphatase family metal-dependent hydrolase